jgi:hypothetical protein
MKLKFSSRIYEKTQISNFMKIDPVGTKLFHADGQRDRHNKSYICVQDLRCERAKSSQYVLWRKSLNVKGQAEKYNSPCALRQGTCGIRFHSFILT